MKIIESQPELLVDKKLWAHIHDENVTNGAIPLEGVLEEKALMGELRTPEQLNGWFSALKGPFGLGGKPEALRRKLKPGYPSI